MTTTEKKGCCEKCLDYDNDGGRYCFLEKDCPCHQIPIQEGNPHMMNVEELDKAITDTGIEGLLEELAEIADNVQTKTGWKRSFAPCILSILKETIASSEQRTRNEVVDYIRSAMSYHGADLNLVAEEARNLPIKLK